MRNFLADNSVSHGFPWVDDQKKQLRNQTFFIKGDLCPTEHWLVEFVRLGLYRELKPESPAINYWPDD